MANSINKRHNVDIENRKALQKLSREQLKHRLLADIACDIQICNVESWDYKEYLNELKSEIDRLLCVKKM